MFSDINNIEATKTLLNHSRGTDDFVKFVTKLTCEGDIVRAEWFQEKTYLTRIGLKKGQSEDLSCGYIHDDELY